MGSEPRPPVDRPSSPTPLEYEAHLRDNTHVRFRRIRHDDKQRLQEGLQAMSPASRYRRFFRSIDHLSARELEYFVNVDGTEHDAWVAVAPEGHEERGLGVARWIRLKNDPEAAEGAVTVVDAYQGRGIGRTLLWLAARSATQAGVRRIEASIMGDNLQALNLVRSLGAELGGIESGVFLLGITLPADVAQLDASPPPLPLRATTAQSDGG